MALDPQVKKLLDSMAETGAPAIESLPPEQARTAFKALNQGDGKVEPVHNVQNRRISGPEGEIPVRIYTPGETGPYPALVYYHGGGWVIGDLDTHDNVCRTLSNAADALVVSVDYRLAPEHKFPAAVDDCYAATQWVADHANEINVDSSRIAIGGDSAGGNLTGVISQLAKKHGTPSLVHQVLFYPATDFTADTASLHENAEGYFLTLGDMIYFRDHYLRSHEDRNHPLASPFLSDDLSGLPPATVITAGYDPLRDEGEAYARKLKEAGVPVTQTRYDGMIHGFISMAADVDQGKKALQEAAGELRTAFRK